MFDLRKVVGFQWDTGNTNKNYEKHGITMREAEALFTDENALLVEDIDHSQKETRYVIIGKTEDEIVLFAAFTIRKNRVRIISVRNANKKERNEYEKT